MHIKITISISNKSFLLTSKQTAPIIIIFFIILLSVRQIHKLKNSYDIGFWQIKRCYYRAILLNSFKNLYKIFRLRVANNFVQENNFRDTLLKINTNKIYQQIDNVIDKKQVSKKTAFLK